MRLIGSILVSSLATAAFSAEVYRWTDEQGNVAYSDRPLSARAEIVTVTTTRPSSAPLLQPAQPTAAQPAAAAPAAAAAAPPAQTSTQPSPEARARNCEIARERMERYFSTNRLYRQLADGGRQYLSDAEIDRARAQAAADVETWCG